jgi:uncharacterized protein (DUF983 family)
MTEKIITRQLNTDGQGCRAHRAYLMPPASTYRQAVTNVPCPACEGGTVRWYEAGYVPGYRICDQCGIHFLARGNAQAPELVVVD